MCSAKKPRSARKRWFLKSTKTTRCTRLRSQPSTRPNAKPGAGTPCFRCGGTNHLADECRFKDTVCRACQKKGHVERVCRSKPSGNRTQRPTPKPRQRYSQALVHAVSETAPRQTLFDSDDEFAIYYVRAPREGKPPAPIFVQAQVNDRNLRMELDTGAGVSVLPTSMYQQYFSATPLQSSALRLTTYNNEQLICRGVLPVRVVINGQPADTELYVVDCKGPTLFGRSWLELFCLDWTAIKAVHAGGQQAALEELKRKYAAVFDDSQGCLQGVEARLHLKPDAKPRFLKARPLPLTLKPKVEAEIRRMEEADILTRVDWSEWATPIVPVIKPNGKVRLCGDFKVTLNPHLHVDQHPLPLIDEIFASLSGGQRFTKLDLKAAYTLRCVWRNSHDHS